MHVNKNWKEHKEIVKGGSEAPWMAKPKKDSESYGINQALEAKNGTNLNYWINPSTSLQEKKVELRENKFSPQ